MFVTLKVYDVLGNEIVILVNEEKAVGEYQIDFDGNARASGIYLYQFQARDLHTGKAAFNKTEKMILLK